MLTIKGIDKRLIEADGDLQFVNSLDNYEVIGEKVALAVIVVGGAEILSLGVYITALLVVVSGELVGEEDIFYRVGVVVIDYHSEREKSYHGDGYEREKYFKYEHYGRFFALWDIILVLVIVGVSFYIFHLKIPRVSYDAYIII